MAPQISDETIPISRRYAIALTTEDRYHHHIMIKESPQKQEKQIVVDPLSLKQQEATSFPPPLQPPKSKFLSISQPNSATSSPRFLSKKKSKVESLESPPYPAESYLQKSKSCGERRACPPSDEFDLWSVIKRDTTNTHRQGSFQKPEAMKDSPRSSRITARKNIDPPPADKGFKCSCLYLPGFGKAKPVRPKKEESQISSMDRVISRTVSLEKFECGSWAPSPRAIKPVQDQVEGNESVSSYFDLPSELIRCGGGEDAHSPVAAAFVFDNNKDIKGVLKNGSPGGNRKSDASPRHVRFSTPSSPASPASSCITPRLQKAREEFNAFLEAAQSA
ncbi:uncharacterized protein LOC129305448 [Prosopis cineraria]|uniref:uncharacterized protein LOC129305448 n=1 Tax=Prosopis cineraria TaxID=364024 RepID=UPI00240F8D6A|nr:uncharacterized protein LOC129305448 [Prosopis cineraria]